jgi:hypothetical protein
LVAAQVAVHPLALAAWAAKVLLLLVVHQVIRVVVVVLDYWPTVLLQ